MFAAIRAHVQADISKDPGWGSCVLKEAGKKHVFSGVQHSSVCGCFATGLGMSKQCVGPKVLS